MKSAPIRSLCVALSFSAIALGEDEAVVHEAPPAAPPGSPWEFILTPYAWLPALNGEVGRLPLVADLDASYGDILDNLEWSLAARFEARNGPWGILMDGFYAELGASGPTRSPLYGDADTDLDQFLGELAVAYRVWESEKGFLDVYGGIRYNYLAVEVSAPLDSRAIRATGANASERIVNTLGREADAIIKPRIEEFKTAAAARRAEIERELSEAIRSKAEQVVNRKVQKIRDQGGLTPRQIREIRRRIAQGRENLGLARAQAALIRAELRAAADARLQNKVERARARVDQAEQALAVAIAEGLEDNLPTRVSRSGDWVDPILGLRGEYRIHERWYLAGKGDIGGFGLAFGLAWSLQGSLGYRFTDNVSAEFGYRYLDTDYSSGNFKYDMREHGFQLAVNIRF